MSEKNFDLNLDDGRKKIYINKEKYGEDRVIYINPSDINIFTRFSKAEKEIDKFLEEQQNKDLNENEDFLACLEEADKYVRKQIDYIFDYNVSDVVFGEIFTTAEVNGQPYIKVFMESILPIIEKSMKTYSNKLEKNISKYMDRYKK